MNIGFACQIVGHREYGIRTCRLDSATEQQLRVITETNLQTLLRMLQYVHGNNIGLFRISSDIIPFGSHPQSSYPWYEEHEAMLAAIGAYVKEKNIRVSMHPGQYTVINSPKEDVVERAVLDLVYHAKFLDMLGLPPSHKMILHIGGAYGDRKAAIERFIERGKRLPEPVLNRLVIENDDKIFTADEVLHVCQVLSLPAVFDTLHFACNPGQRSDMAECIRDCGQTWKSKDGRQKIHYSQQKAGEKPGAHSSTIDVEAWLRECALFQQVDVMLEVKDKNLSAVKCHLITNGGPRSILEKEWSRYKYLVMCHSQKHYEQIGALFQKEVSPVNFFRLVDEALSVQPTPNTVRNAAEHIWGYFKDKENASGFQNLLGRYEKGERSQDAVFSYLYRLAAKHQMHYLLDGYSFYEQ